ncbi:hypothetical protein CKA32_003860 [Geitlerinema sp. FC II]|nr:hypothetical protein CKA32_003860 [Geitlerinema sp. FC II]
MLSISYLIDFIFYIVLFLMFFYDLTELSFSKDFTVYLH